MLTRFRITAAPVTTLTGVATVVAHHTQLSVSVAGHLKIPIGEFTRRQRTSRIRQGIKHFPKGPIAVHKLVFNRTGCQIQHHLVHAVSVVIAHRRARAAPAVDAASGHVDTALQGFLRHVDLKAHAVKSRDAAVIAAVSAERLLNAWPCGQPVQRIGLRVAVVVAGEGLAFVPTGRGINDRMRHVDEAFPPFSNARVVEGGL